MKKFSKGLATKKKSTDSARAKRGPKEQEIESDDADQIELDMQDPEDLAMPLTAKASRKSSTHRFTLSGGVQKSLADVEADFVEQWGKKYAGSLRKSDNESQDDGAGFQDFDDEERELEFEDPSIGSDHSDSEHEDNRMFASAREEAAAEGRILKEILFDVGVAMECRLALEPLLTAVNEGKLSSSDAFEKIFCQVLRLLYPDEQTGMSLSSIWNGFLTLEHQELMDEAQEVLSSLFSTSSSANLQANNKKGKRAAQPQQIINRSVWDQGQMLLASAEQRQRLFLRSQKKRARLEEGKAPEESMSLIYEDSDFYTIQAKDWSSLAIASGFFSAKQESSSSAKTRVLHNASSIVSNCINTNATKKHIDWRRGKGRTLKFEQHPLLAGLLAPRRLAIDWSDERRAELVVSLLGGAKAASVSAI